MQIIKRLSRRTSRTHYPLFLYPKTPFHRTPLLNLLLDSLRTSIRGYLELHSPCHLLFEEKCLLLTWTTLGFHLLSQLDCEGIFRYQILSRIEERCSSPCRPPESRREFHVYFHPSFVKVITYRRTRLAVPPPSNILAGIEMAENLRPLNVLPRIKADRGRISLALHYIFQTHRNS